MFCGCLLFIIISDTRRSSDLEEACSCMGAQVHDRTLSSHGLVCILASHGTIELLRSKLTWGRLPEASQIQT